MTLSTSELLYLLSICCMYFIFFLFNSVFIENNCMDSHYIIPEDFSEIINNFINYLYYLHYTLHAYNILLLTAVKCAANSSQ